MDESDDGDPVSQWTNAVVDVGGVAAAERIAEEVYCDYHQDIVLYLLYNSVCPLMK